MYLLSGDVADGPDADLLTTIAHLFDIVAVEKPCLDLVPLLPFAGWTLGGLPHRHLLTRALLSAKCAHTHCTVVLGVTT